MRQTGSSLAVLNMIINELGDLAENFLGKCVNLCVISSRTFLRLFSPITAERKLRTDSVFSTVLFFRDIVYQLNARFQDERNSIYITLQLENN